MPRGQAGLTVIQLRPARPAKPRPDRASTRRASRQQPGWPPDIREAIMALWGDMCALIAWTDPACWGPVDVHHRQLVGMGGTSRPAAHAPPVGLPLCRGHHVFWVHANRAQARDWGLIVRRNSKIPPAQARLSVDRGMTWWRLTDGGDRLPWTPAEGEAA